MFHRLHHFLCKVHINQLRSFIVSKLFALLRVHHIHLVQQWAQFLIASALWTPFSLLFDHNFVPIPVLLAHRVQPLNQLHLLLLILFLFIIDLFNLGVFWVELQLHFHNQVFIFLNHMLALRNLPVKFVDVGKCSLHLGHGFLQLRDLLWLLLFLLSARNDQVISNSCLVSRLDLLQSFF